MRVISGAPIRIISGGQTGADQGALVAAELLGIPTGGWMPRGFLTEAGPCPALRDMYGMQEHRSDKYPPRTRANVRDSDGTVWLSDDDEDSRGQACTYRAADDYGRPYLRNPTAQTLRAWVYTYKILVLNVAGPRASRDPLAHRRAAELIIEAFREKS